jgi:TRAP-type mannitol/chloroaromatic compound transport system permease small subunit
MSASSHQQQQYHIPVVVFLNSIVKRVAETTAWLNVVLVAVILVQVVLRYGFNHGLVPLEEIIWHLYSISFMFGMAYSITNDSHIRVDIVHMNLPRKTQHILEILGILFLLMPFLWVLFDHSLGWTIEAFRVDESSANPTGLPYRWVIKSVVPMTMVLMFVAALARLIQEVLLLMHIGKEPEELYPGRVSAMRSFFHLNPVDQDQNSKHGGDSNAS